MRTRGNAPNRIATASMRSDAKRDEPEGRDRFQGSLKNLAVVVAADRVKFVAVEVMVVERRSEWADGERPVALILDVQDDVVYLA